MSDTARRTRWWKVVLGVVALLVAISIVAPADDDTDAAAQDRPAAGEGTTSTTEPDRRPTTETAPASTATPPSTETSAPGGSPGGRYEVVHVVDGDTIKVTGGVDVRLIGIDTPERGVCGYAEAAAALAAMVDGRYVQLVPGARDDSDRYRRLLRYVEVDGVDANLEMVRTGHAIARYDSRDGYGRHAREDRYVAADAASPNPSRCERGRSTPSTPSTPSTTLAPAPDAPGGGMLDPRFSTCGEAIRNGYGQYRRGIDPEYDWYRDADRDGIVCE